MLLIAIVHAAAVLLVNILLKAFMRCLPLTLPAADQDCRARRGFGKHY